MFLDRNALTEPVRRQTGDPSAEILAFDVGALAAGFAEASTGGLGTRRVTGRARTADGERSFDMVAKGFARSGSGNDDQTSWRYWRREALAYASGLLPDAAGALRAPHCYGDDLRPDEAAIYLEYVDGGADWTFDDYAFAAERLGRFNGETSGRKRGDDLPWMLPGRVDDWLGEAAPALAGLAERRSDPVLSVWLANDRFDRTLTLWQGAGRLREALVALPRCLCHHDAFRNNLILHPRPGGERELVGVDWSMFGSGEIGSDLMPLVGVTLQFMQVPPDRVRSLEATVWAACVVGLRQAGWQGQERDVRLAFAASTALVLGVASLHIWYKALTEPEYEAIIRKVFGVHQSVVLRHFASIQDYYVALGEEALEFAG